MNENTLEQPILETESNQQTDSTLTENQEGSMIGKFKDAKTLLDAYNNLQAEFTRKSQKLAEFQKELEENANFKTYSSVDDFIKKTQYTYYTKEALEKVAKDVAYFAQKEGLTAHAKSAVIRTEE